jgi:hypothetical protein
MSKKIVPIKYTSRSFETIKNDLVEHAKRYYPDSYKDFNEASFGSLMIDTVAYVGDILSFYLDYQANESFLDTASEFENVLKIAKQMGYKHNLGSTSTGIATFYVSVPANSSGLGPNLAYAPILKKGSTFSTKNKVKFILNEDVRFDLSTNEVRPLTIGDNGLPLTYGIKATGLVISGIIKAETVTVGQFERFLRVPLTQQNIVEILSIFDTEGNQYFEVDYLSQNIVYRSITNKDPTTSNLAKEILKPFMVPRRFVVDNSLTTTFLQFGASSDVIIPDDKSMITEPARVVLDIHGKDYISSDSFDPNRLLNSDKMGVAPSNTTLTITYRYNPPGTSINFAVDSLANVETADFSFINEQNLVPSILTQVRTSLEVTNEMPIRGEVDTFDSKELKIRIKNSFSTQNRAVTTEDYKALCYSMPTKFGSIKRVGIFRDDDSLKRNLNLFVLCEDENGYLTSANQIVKTNLKTWISRNKMINDTIDILDGRVVNYGIEFVVVGSSERQKYDILTDCVTQLKKDFSRLPEFGETFFLSSILTSLKKVDSVVDVVGVKIVPKVGGTYSDLNFDIDRYTSSDKRYINVPVNVVMELKFPNVDIKGTVL